MRLEAENVTKRIGKRIILDNVNLTMQSGQIYGFVGRNGSGKTMLFRALSGLIKIDQGKISCDDKILHRDIEILPNLGIIIENAGIYPELTGIQNLRYLAKARKKIGEEELKEAILRVGLEPDDRRAVRKYSLGMKQRIVLAQAIMEKPDILMLDEPTNALDEEGVNDIRILIQQERERGALVLLASHNKEDMQMLADHIFYMESGRIKE